LSTASSRAGICTGMANLLNRLLLAREIGRDKLNTALPGTAMLDSALTAAIKHAIRTILGGS
jgi:hypothetical protein